MVLPDLRCKRKDCVTHPHVRPQILLQLELARRFEDIHGRTADHASPVKR